MPDIFRSKYPLIRGSSYAEVAPQARAEYYKFRRRTKRRPYIRSAYFSREKIFLVVFWDHLAQKHRKDQMSRLRFYIAALDLLRHSVAEPSIKKDTYKRTILYYRFEGVTKDGVGFYVQVKRDGKTGRKDFMSVFEVRAKNKKDPPHCSLETTGRKPSGNMIQIDISDVNMSCI